MLANKSIAVDGQSASVLLYGGGNESKPTTLRGSRINSAEAVRIGGPVTI